MVVQATFLDGSVECLGGCTSVGDVKRCAAVLKGLPRHDDVQVLTADGFLLGDEDSIPPEVSVLIQGGSISLSVCRHGVELTRVLVEATLVVGDLCYMVCDALGLNFGARVALSFQGRSMNSTCRQLGYYGIQEGSVVEILSFYESKANFVHEHHRLRSNFLESTNSLRSFDQLQCANLLPLAEISYGCGSNFSTISSRGAGSRAVDFVGALPELLTPLECAEILDNARRLNICPLDVGSGVQKSRKYRRLLVHDSKLADVLWLRAERSIRAALQDVDLKPLGFGCSHGEWALVGLNPAIRINQYAGGGFIGPHRDSQYSRNLDCRSLCTLLIPLQSKGFVRFYQPRQRVDCRNMTLAEEVAARGGLHAGFVATDHAYHAGQAVIMGQAVLHEGLPDDGYGPAKAILRTDVIVQRVRSPPLLPVLTACERRDHAAALKCFRQAQQADLRGEPSDELYERALSYRYAYPHGNYDVTSGPQHVVDCDTAEPAAEPGSLIGMSAASDETRATATDPFLSHHQSFIMPTLVYHSGPIAAFILSSTQKQSVLEEQLGPGESVANAHLRVVAMYSFHLLGHPSESCGLYTARFDPITYEIVAVPLRNLLCDAFLSRRCFGSVYNVWAVNAAMPDPAADFARAVDRTHMVLAHGCNHIGEDVVSKCNSVVQSFAKTVGEFNHEKDEYDSVSSSNDDEPVACPDDGSDGFVDRLAIIQDNMARRVPPGELYLTGLLDSGRRGLPGRDVVSMDSITATRRGLCNGQYGNCGEEEVNSRTERLEHRVMNNLVFDFDKRSMIVTNWNGPSPCGDAAVCLDDPVSLWAELRREVEEAGFDYDSFTKYSVGLHDILEDEDHSFQYAGGCGCKPYNKTLHLSLKDFDGSDHATRVLIAAGAPSEAFGRVLEDGDVLVWTIYHGIAAL